MFLRQYIAEDRKVKQIDTNKKGFTENLRIYIIMSTNLTYSIKLNADTEDASSIVRTLEGHRDVWNEMSRDIFSSKEYGKKEIHDRNYYKCRELFGTKSQVVIRAKDAVYATYKTLKTQKMLDKLKNPCIMTNLAMRLDKRMYTWVPDGIRLSTCNGMVACSYRPYKKFSEMFSSYEAADPLLYERDGELWLAVSFKVPEPSHIEGSVLGVDLGFRRMATTSEGRVIHDKEFLKRKRTIRHNQRVLQSKVKKTNSSSAKKKLKKMKRKERNSNKKHCEKVASDILKTKCTTIVMEDLSSLKKNRTGKKGSSRSSRNRLSQGLFFTLLQITTYKARLLGKRVITVNPAYTSKDDHRGGPRGKRAGCRYYARDGLVFDADWQAAINIASRHASKTKPERPVSFTLPIDGRMNLTGRPPSDGQSCGLDPKGPKRASPLL